MSPNELTERSASLSVDIIELLEEIGLTRKEIEIYDYLLISGAAMPSAIARDTGQPRGRIYEGMRNLVAKGFAKERPTRPILFAPTPLPEVLAAAQARLSRHLIVVRHAQTIGAKGALGELEPAPIPPMRMRDVSVLSGRRACYAEITRMVENATTFFWISGGGRFAARLSNMPNLLDTIQNAAARGVDVKIIFPQTQALGRALSLVDATRTRPLLHQVNKDDNGPLVACANESTSLELIAQPDDDAPTRGDDVAIQIADPLFAARQKRRLNRLVVTVKPVTAPATFPWLGPNHGTDIFGEAIKRATVEVQVLGSPEWGTYMSANWAHDKPAYDAAVQRGVLLRAVGTHDAAKPEDLLKFQESWKIRLVDQLPMWLTIVDGKELYQAFPHPSLGGVPQFRRSEEQHEIRFYQGIFERLWAGAPDLSRPPLSPGPPDAQSEQEHETTSAEA